MLVPNSHLVTEEAREHCRQLQSDARSYRVQSSGKTSTPALGQRVLVQFAHGLIHTGEMLLARFELMRSESQQQVRKFNY